MVAQMNEIIKRMREKRTSMGLSYQDLSVLTGLSKSTLQRYETGFIKNMPIDKLEIVAKALKTTPEYLMGWETEENPELEDPQACPTRILAAHLEEGEYTEEELEQIREFADFLRSKRDRHD